MSKEIKLAAFTMACVTHQTTGQWKNPLHGVRDRYCDLHYWTELAQTLERGFFDCVFLADVHGTYSVYKGSNRTAIEGGAQFPNNDPTFLIPAMAAATRHLGFGCTWSTTYFPPYHTAKVFSTLDHLTNGRVGWNVVTSYLTDALANFGIEKNLEHDLRYERADEYMSVVYKLWEHSWEEGAIIRDEVRDLYTDADKVHQIDHQGKWFSVPGPHMCEPSAQRTPTLLQAGASSRGIEFAGTHAEAVFVAHPTTQATAPYVRQVRDAAAAAGRSRDDVKILQGIAVVAAVTDEEAHLKARTISGFSSLETPLALLAGWSGLDLSTLPRGKSLDDVDESEWQAIRGLRGHVSAIDPDRDWTVEAISEWMSVGSIMTSLIGSPQTIADEMERWMDEADIDGFNIHVPAQPTGFVDFVDLVVPELQRRGRMRSAYEGSTLRESLFGSGRKRLPPTHPAFHDLPPWRQ